MRKKTVDYNKLLKYVKEKENDIKTSVQKCFSH